MAIALFALSLVMIVGGIAAVVQGFPYVRLESGLAMVIGGTTAASAGAVLIGIAVAILQMRRLAEMLARRGATAAHGPVLADDVPGSAAFRAPAFEDPPPVSSEPRSGPAGTAGLAGVSLGAMSDLLGQGSPPRSADPHPGRALEIEPPLPDLLPPAVPGPVAPPAPGEPISPDEDLFAMPDDRLGPDIVRAVEEPPIEEPAKPDPAQEELALRPALDEAAPTADPAPQSQEPQAPEPEAEKPKPEELQVVGTYSSGANTYVMFANGTIQADTPRGRFTFQSLDELKTFVDSGGETNARGAA